MVRVALAIALVFPAVGHAAGYWLMDRGASSYSRGGANFANPGDPIALYANPAALAGLRGLQLNADLQLGRDLRSFARATDMIDGKPRSYPGVENSWRDFSGSPGLFATYNTARLGLKELTLGAGVYGPPRVDAKFPDNGPQRYSEIQSRHVQIHYGLGLGLQLPYKALRLGVTGMLISQIVDSRLRLNAAIIDNPSAPENARYDATVHLRARQDGIPSAIVGLSFEPIDRVTAAGSYQLPYNVHARGKAEVVLGEGYDGLAGVEGDAVEIKRLKMPAIARAAMQYRGQRYDVEVVYVWEGWKRNDRLDIDTQAIQIVPIVGEAYSVPNQTRATHMRNTYSLRLGGALRAVPGVFTLRAGTYYERAAIAPKWLSAGSFDLDKWGLTLGARVDLLYGLWIDLGAGYAYWLPRTVSNSAVTLTNAFTGDTGRPIANGVYKNHQFFLLAGLGVHL